MDPRTWTLILNTLILASGTCALSLPPGALLAWLLARTDLPGRRIGMVLLGVMLFVPLYLQAAAWQAGFGLQGWYTLSAGSAVLLDGWPGALWVHAMAAVPWVVLIVGVSLRLVEPELEEQALLDGSPLRVFARVTLPGALSAIGIAALWIAIITAGEMTVTDLFAVRTYAEELYTRSAIGRQPGEAALGVLPGMILTGCLAVAGLWLCGKIAPRDRPPSLRRQFVFRLYRWRWPIAVLVALLLLLAIGVPLGSLIYKSGVVVTQTETGRVRVWSATKCLQIVAESPWRYHRELGWSLGIGTLAATGAMAAAVCLAWPARRGRFWAIPALAVAAVCLAVPGPLVGLGVIGLLNRPGCPLLLELYDNSIFAPCLVLLIRGLPPATLILWQAFRTVPDELLEAAAVDGAGPLARFRRIVLPCWLPAAVLAWMVALAVALGDLAASILVMPPGVSTLSIRIFGLLHYGVEDQVAGICLAQLVIFAAVAVTVAWLVRRWGHERAVR